MRIVSFVCAFEECLVEASFRHSRFASSNQKNGPPFGIEEKGNSPDTTGGIEPQFLHVCVSRTFQGVGMGPFQNWTELLQETCFGQQLILRGGGPFMELGVEIILNTTSQPAIERDSPATPA